MPTMAFPVEFRDPQIAGKMAQVDVQIDKVQESRIAGSR